MSNETEPVYLDDVEVKLLDWMGSDDSIVQAAQVSVIGGNDAEMSDAKRRGLIGYLMRQKHGSPFEHNSMKFYVKAPIFVFREFMRHRIGFCLPGSARIPVGTWKNGKTKSIEDVYRDWKIGVPDSLGRTRLLASTQHLMTRTLNTDTGLIEHTRMVDVYQSGVKPIIRIELASGRVLRATPDHQIWTLDGWQIAGSLRPNMAVARQGKVVHGDRVGVPMRLRQGIQFWTTSMKAKVVTAVTDTCYSCGDQFLYEDLQVDHVVPVSADLAKALDVTNLAPICGPCHDRKSGVESWDSGVERRQLQLGARWDRVVSVRSDGEEMTYDIEMPEPWHNFIADDVVVHNSYNEMSGRYTKLEPEFYVPKDDRPLVNTGTSAHPNFEPGSPELTVDFQNRVVDAYDQAWATYEWLLEMGVGNEMARVVLPVGIYSQMYVTCNLRSLLNFLSLRTKDPNALFPSNPQHEIELVARKMEEAVEPIFPLAMAAYNDSHRVAP